MQITAPDDRLYVVVGVLTDSDGRLFVQQRKPGTPSAGRWEFPGGKVESNEIVSEALARELYEELGIKVTQTEPLIQIAHDYIYARVWLDVFSVFDYDDEVTACEGQVIKWLFIDEIKQLNLLEPVWQILRAIPVSIIN